MTHENIFNCPKCKKPLKRLPKGKHTCSCGEIIFIECNDLKKFNVSNDKELFSGNAPSSIEVLKGSAIIAAFIIAISAITLSMFDLMFWVAISASLIIGFIPLIIIIEIYHWIKNENSVTRPFFKGTIFGLIYGTFFIIYVFYDASGEKGLVAVDFAPYLFIAFGSVGLFIGLIYKKLQRTIILNRK